jgi:AhpD family alkylhydroperoxidase
MATTREIVDELREPTRSLRAAAPEAWAGFKAMHDAAMADGALPRKVKELIALAIAVTRECDGCIASHGRGAAHFGATAEEVSEALSVALLMNGGPATVYGPRAWAAYLEHAPAGAAAAPAKTAGARAAAGPATAPATPA